MNHRNVPLKPRTHHIHCMLANLAMNYILKKRKEKKKERKDSRGIPPDTAKTYQKSTELLNTQCSLQRKHLDHTAHAVTALSVLKTMVQHSESPPNVKGSGKVGSGMRRASEQWRHCTLLHSRTVPRAWTGHPLLHLLQQSFALRASVPPPTSYPQKEPDRVASTLENRARHNI